MGCNSSNNQEVKNGGSGTMPACDEGHHVCRQLYGDFYYCTLAGSYFLCFFFEEAVVVGIILVGETALAALPFVEVWFTFTG